MTAKETREKNIQIPENLVDDFETVVNDAIKTVNEGYDLAQLHQLQRKVEAHYTKNEEIIICRDDVVTIWDYLDTDSALYRYLMPFYK